MQLLVIFLAVLTLAVLASSRWLLEVGRSPVVVQLTASGLLFLVVGAILGPSATAMLGADDLRDIRPLASLGLGVCGLIIGTNLDPRLLRQLPARAITASVVQSALAFLLVTAAMAVVFFFASGLTTAGIAGASAMLGAAASVSSAHYAVLWYRSGKLDRARGLSVALVAMLDDSVGLLAIAVSFVLAAGATVGLGLGLVSAALLFGTVCGALVVYLIHKVDDRAELTAILLGGAALVSGVAAFLRISALLAGVAFGATLVLIGGEQVGRVVRALSRIERPVYLLVLFLIGAHVDVRDWQAWALVPLFVAFRFLGKLWGGRLAGRVARDTLRFPRELGLALVAQGGVSLCLALEYLFLVQRRSTSLIFDVVVIAAVVNEFLAARTIGLSVEPRGASPASPPVQRSAA